MHRWTDILTRGGRERAARRRTLQDLTTRLEHLRAHSRRQADRDSLEGSRNAIIQLLKGPALDGPTIDGLVRAAENLMHGARAGRLVPPRAPPARSRERRVRIARPPGARVLQIAEFLVSRRVYETVFAQLVHDMREEVFEATSAGRPWRARVARMRGYLAFGATALAVAVESPLGRLVRAVRAVRAVGRSE